MKRLVVFMLLALISVAGSVSVQAQNRISIQEHDRQVRKAEKKQRKAMKKAAKKQRKAMKKSAKAQRKALTKVHQRAAR